MRVFQIIYYLFFGFVGLVAGLLLLSIFPITGNFKVLTVESGSMAPSIKMGSIVVVKPMKDYQIGDVITFGEMTKAASLITHRIFEVEVKDSQNFYTTKGDANNGPDQKQITEKEIIGKVLFDIPWIGYAVSVAKKPIGFLFIIIVPALLVIIDEAVKIKKELKKSKQGISEQEKID